MENTVKFEGNREKKAAIFTRTSPEKDSATAPFVLALWDAKLDVNACIAALIAHTTMSCVCVCVGYMLSPRGWNHKAFGLQH